MADSNEKEKAMVDTASPATKYEAMLAELGGLGSGPTEDKTVLVFQVLDQIVPHLGVFVSVMQMCRDELFDAVYSNQYTGSQQQPPRYIQKIPYFTLVKRIFDERDEKNFELTQQLDVVKKRLFDKQKQYEQATDTIVDLQKEVEQLQETITQLEDGLEEKHQDIQGLEMTINELGASAEKMQQQLTAEISDLQEDLHESKAEGNYLMQYKMGYDDLQNAFQDQNGHEEFTPRKKKRPNIATKRAHLISSIENATKLEEQILGVQNASIEEFDKFLEDHKAQLAQDSHDGNETDRSYQLQDMDIEKADHQLLVMQERFQKSIHEIMTELELLRQHKTMLQEQLQVLEENKPALKRKNKSRKGSRPTTQESSLSLGLEEDLEEEENPALDPFIVQERVFSKYAAMIYTSDNNAKTFHEFKDAKFCPSCGEKTVLCPHKILKQEHVFKMPLSCTHIKISRPKVRINMDMIENMFHEQTESDDLAGLSSAGACKRLHSRVSDVAALSPYMPSEGSGESPESTDTSAVPGGDGTHFTHTVYRLWEDYKARTSLERSVPRPLSPTRAISLIEQFAAYMLSQDEYATESDEIHHTLDSLYIFLFDRYLKPDVAFLAAHDLIMSLADNSVTHKIIWLFTNILIGNLDAAVFRYVLLIGDFIQEVDWQEVEDFRAFAAVIYPFLTEDDLENLQMGYTSFSENKMTETLVAEYIIHTIVKYREPRFLEMEQKLLNTPGKEMHFMTEAEFVESSENILGVVNDKLRKRLYNEAFTYVKNKDGMTEGVPIARLSQITSYLSLLEIAPVIRSEVASKVSQARENTSGAPKLLMKRAVPTYAMHYNLLTMHNAKVLGSNIVRRNRVRRQRDGGTFDDEL